MQQGYALPSSQAMLHPYLHLGGRLPLCCQRQLLLQGLRLGPELSNLQQGGLMHACVSNMCVSNRVLLNI